MVWVLRVAFRVVTTLRTGLFGIAALLRAGDVRNSHRAVWAASHGADAPFPLAQDGRGPSPACGIEGRVTAREKGGVRGASRLRARDAAHMEPVLRRGQRLPRLLNPAARPVRLIGRPLVTSDVSSAVCGQ